ncbi:hypothetical protein R1flu_027291 [Riccia fluitans]|uniref:Uncharacterized protein n=1 Tax=Riccia fluitans TaxID=41844 RepID=A0ABD1XJ34_9MARC
MELPAFRREGSNRHIKDCDRASQQLTFEIRALNNRERQRVAELASLHDMESTSRALDKEEREIESAFLGSIWVNLLQHMRRSSRELRKATYVKLFKSVKCSQRWYTF